ncbi:hypothetical protein [Acidimangrovimonas sediminis]|uniref:hypothetical protein n=1 Tax=Acidimangrovimonas sediminis TaxID=2056283 RepID=UPI000C80F833|nr:hypothetical protein [Acidimangrovimonas sediminis]
MALLSGLLAGALPALPAAATVLGRMEAQIAGRHITYHTSDTAAAGSGWEARANRKVVSILWKGPAPTDLLLMEMTLENGSPASARLLLPEARQGAVEAKAPRDLSVRLQAVRTDGSWLKLKGRATGTFYPLRRGGALLPDDGLPVTVRFDTWVPGIAPPAQSKPSHRKTGKTATETETGATRKAHPAAPERSPLPKPRAPAPTAAHQETP